KATMEVPAPSSGTVEKLLIKIGDRVSCGSPILLLRGGDGAIVQPKSLLSQQDPEPAALSRAQSQSSSPPGSEKSFSRRDTTSVHASPAVRRLARELGIDIAKLKGTGEKGRITREDVKAFARAPAQIVPAPAGTAGDAAFPELPPVDFSKFGPIETKLLPRIKK